jgi:hypothetical protein
MSTKTITHSGQGQYGRILIGPLGTDIPADSEGCAVCGRRNALSAIDAQRGRW